MIPHGGMFTTCPLFHEAHGFDDTKLYFSVFHFSVLGFCSSQLNIAKLKQQIYCRLLRVKKVAGAFGKKAPAWLCGGRSGFFQFRIINYQLSIVNYQLSIVNYQLSIINYQLSIVN